MAEQLIYTDLDGLKVSTLKNWKLNPLTTVDRLSLGVSLGPVNIGLPVFDTDLLSAFFWTGSTWIQSGGIIPATAWGNITGNINDQTDLITLFNTKVNTSALSAVAFSGNYSDLSNRPTIPPGQIQTDYTQTNPAALDFLKNKPVLSLVATTGQYSDLIGIPTFAAVAFSGSYTDLINTPAIPPGQIQSDYTQANTAALDYIKNKPTLAAVALSGQYSDLIGSPTVLSHFTNDVGFITASSTNTLTNKSGNISQWTNDSGYITSASILHPGGATTNVQYNNAGAFAGSADFTWDNTAKLLTLNGTFLSSTGGTPSIPGVAVAPGRGLYSGGSQFLQVTLGGQIPVQFVGAGSSSWGGPSMTMGKATNASANAQLEIGATFTQTANSVIYVTALINPIINQTGTANGITRGLYVNPTLTAATDFRAIESNRSLTGAMQSVNTVITETWNTTGNPAALQVLVTKTAAGTTSQLLNISQDTISRLLIPVDSARVVFNANGININTSTAGIGGISLTGNPAASNQIRVSPGFILSQQTAMAGVGVNEITIDSGTIGSISGTNNFLVLTGVFNPTSGTATNTAVLISPSVNQTGGANGITRGIYINPSISAATDWRPFEINTNGFGATPVVGNGVFLRNLTSATAILNQSSPSITLEGQGWKTIATAASQPAQIRMYNSISTGTTASFASLQIDSINGAGTLVPMMNLTNNGTTTMGFGSQTVTITNTAGAHLNMLMSNRTQLPQSSIQMAGQLHVGSLIDATSAYIQTVPSTATLAHINLPAGVAKTTPAAGDIWFDGTHFYGTVGSTPIQLDNTNNVKIVGGLANFTPDGITDHFNIPHGLTTVTSHAVTRNTDPNGNLIETKITGANIVVTFVAGPPSVASTIMFNWLAFGV